MRGYRLLEKAISGREVVEYVEGRYVFSKRSNLYKAIITNGYSLNDIGAKIEIVVGAKTKNINCFKMAIVKKGGRE